MFEKNRIYNLVLGGGGVKGLAFVGVYEAAEKRGIRWGNIAGVSAGAMAGSLKAAGYSALELKEILGGFDFKHIKITDIPKKVPIIARYMEFCGEYRIQQEKSIEYFINREFANYRAAPIRSDMASADYRSNILKNIILYGRQGCLYDGDYLEEWVGRVLLKRGIRTFGDLRGGIADKVNPRGYKIRMTAVDTNRTRVIVLPDDIAFYGIDPDELEVAKAVRMSTSVPFAFKPVELKKSEGNITKTYHIVDGGVLDGFPSWLINDSKSIPTLGFKLGGSHKKSILSLDTPLNILKGLIAAVHDIGVPHTITPTDFTATIDTSNISFLDFDLGNEDINYLFNAGKQSAEQLFMGLERRYSDRRLVRALFKWYIVFRRLFS